MIERRRRAASLVLLVAAGLAVSGTAAATPTPAPTQQITLQGSLHLSAAAPVAVQPIAVDTEIGEVEQIAFAATVGDLPTDGSVLVSLEPIEGDAPRIADSTPASTAANGTITAKATFPFSCAARPCSRSYVLVATWVGTPAGASADVAWSLSTIARFRGPAGGGSPSPGRVDVRADASAARAPESADISSETSGEPVHLTETDRSRAWAVDLHRAGPAGVGGGGRSVTQARLSVDATQTAGPVRGSGDAKDRRVELRLDPPVQVRIAGVAGRELARWTTDGDLAFDPFEGCDGDAACDRTLTIELLWADGRPDTAFDAAWSIDLASIGIGGAMAPLRTVVADLPQPALAHAALSGSFDAAGPTGRGRTAFVLTGAPDPEAIWAPSTLGLPARALITVRATSLGGSPLPADTVVEVTAIGMDYDAGAPFTTKVEVGIGAEAIFAFQPNLGCAPGGCRATGTIGSWVRSQRGDPMPADLDVRVDWTMDVGLAVAATPGIVWAVDPPPSPPPSVGP